MGDILKGLANVLTFLGTTAAAVLAVVGFINAGMLDIQTAAFVAAIQQFGYAAGTVGLYLHMHFTFNLFGISISTDNIPGK